MKFLLLLGCTKNAKPTSIITKIIEIVLLCYLSISEEAGNISVEN
jgi:hypothetical protein